jgi:hypothetical protein
LKRQKIQANLGSQSNYHIQNELNEMQGQKSDYKYFGRVSPAALKQLQGK